MEDQEDQEVQEDQEEQEDSQEQIDHVEMPHNQENGRSSPDQSSPINRGERKSSKKLSRIIQFKQQQNQQMEKKRSAVQGPTSETKCDKIKKCLDSFVENTVVSVIMSIITIYALFGDDIRQMVVPMSYDELFWTFNIAAMAAFTIEIIICSIAKKGYWLGFFFWLDIISTLSLLLDIGWVSESLFGSSGSSSASSAASLARAGRASRVGTKAGRIVRIVRLIRLVKLYKHAQQALLKEAELLDQADDEDGKIKKKIPREGRKSNNKFVKAVNTVIQENKIISLVDGNKNNDGQQKRPSNQGNDTKLNLNLVSPSNPQAQANDQQPPAQGDQQSKAVQHPLDNSKPAQKVGTTPTHKSGLNKVHTSTIDPQGKEVPLQKLESQVPGTNPKAQSNVSTLPKLKKKNQLDPLHPKTPSLDMNPIMLQKNPKPTQDFSKPPKLYMNFELYKQFKKRMNSKKPEASHLKTGSTPQQQLQQFNEFQSVMLQKYPNLLTPQQNLPTQQSNKDQQGMYENGGANSQDLEKQKKGLRNLNQLQLKLNLNDDGKQNEAGGQFQRSVKKQLTSEEFDKKQKGESHGLQFQQTKVGQQLSDLTTKRVIMLVMSVMLSIPLFSTDTYIQLQGSYPTGLRYIYEFSKYGDNTLMKHQMQYYIDYHKTERSPIIYIQFEQIADTCCNLYPGTFFTDSVIGYKDIRTSEQTIYTLTIDGVQIGYSISDDRKDSYMNSWLSILRTVFVSAVLSIGALLFSKDVEDLVLSPIENMLGKVKRIAENPLDAAEIEEKEAFFLEDLFKKGDKKKIAKREEESKMETVILETLIIKIGALLAVGFGEAGSQIIASNMKKGGQVDPMIPGVKIAAVFGFCDIRNFADVTEVLQSKVMVFVNRIALIVHGTVDQFCGQPNKNIGEAFLLVWRYAEDHYSKDADGNIKLKNEERVREFSNLSVLAFLKIMANINMSVKLLDYRRDPQINKKLPNYQIKMGFGLHQGWGIEGAIGSEYKIDASYLSPNVNLASRLEAATRQFGTYLLISGDLYRILTKRCQKNLRHVDTVTVKGSVQPLQLYTCDVSFDNLQKKVLGSDKFEYSDMTRIMKKRKKVIERIKRDRRRKEIEEGKQRITDLFLKDKEIVAMREIFTEEFYTLFAQAIKAYTTGDWENATKILTKTYKLIPGHLDGPSNTLLEVIKSYNGQPPEDWKGYRALTEK